MIVMKVAATEIVSIAEGRIFEVLTPPPNRAYYKTMTPDKLARMRTSIYWEVAYEHLNSALQKCAAENVPPAHSPGLIVREFIQGTELWTSHPIEHEADVMRMWRDAAMRYPAFVHDRCVKQALEHERRVVPAPDVSEHFYIETTIFKNSVVFEEELSYAEHRLGVGPKAIEECRRKGEIPRCRDVREDGTVLLSIYFPMDDKDREWKHDWFVFNVNFDDVVGMDVAAALAAGRARAARDPQKMRIAAEHDMRMLEMKMQNASMGRKEMGEE